MPSLLTLFLVFALAIPAAAPQRAEVIKTPDQVQRDPQAQALKQQHAEAKKLSTRLIELSTEVDADIDNSGEHILPVGTLKKLEEIEKTSKKLRGLLKQ